MPVASAKIVIALFKNMSSKVIFFSKPDAGSDTITSSFKSVTASKPVIAIVSLVVVPMTVGFVKVPPSSTTSFT